MRNQICLLAVIVFNLIYACSCNNSKGQSTKKSIQYSNGTFEGESRAVYTSEPFYGKVTLTIDRNRIIKINYIIRDSSIHETFNGSYEKHYTGNKMYIEQCRNDWKGVMSYPDTLLKYQDINKIDAVSGATWSYNIFKAATKEALKKAVERD
jgi:major membrane immunogen (membrane-anchored lipoprotein)